MNQIRFNYDSETNNFLKHGTSILYKKNKKDIDETLLNWIKAGLMKDKILIFDPRIYLRSIDRNDKKFKTWFYEIILPYCQRYFEYMFPFDDLTDTESELYQIYYNAARNLFSNMNNLIDVIIAEPRDAAEVNNDVDRLAHDIRYDMCSDLLEPIINYKLRQKTRPSLNDENIKRLNLPKDVLTDAYRHLINTWEYSHVRTTTAEPSEQTKRKIMNIINEEKEDSKPNRLEYIDNETYNDRSGRNENAKSVYDYYLSERDKRKQTKIRIPKKYYDVNDYVNAIGYKSPTKIKSLIQQRFGDVKYDLPDRSEMRFPLKQNIKRYSMHVVAAPKTYLMDLMIEDKYMYLLMINVNTRKLWFERIKAKTTTAITNAINSIIRRGCKISYIRADGEQGFKAIITQDYFKSKGIKFSEVPRQIPKYPQFMQNLNMVKAVKSEPYHSSLSLIDRVIRTIRDVAYNLKYDVITPERMTEIIHIYNNAPHETLTHYAGQQTTPNDVDSNPDLEHYIVKNIMKDNYLVSQQPGFSLPVGSSVRVYNERNAMSKRRTDTEPGKHTIVDKKGAFYIIEDEDGNREYKTRVKIN